MAAAPSNPMQPGMMQAADPLAQLRDIHAPEMISAWPPAPGWWLLGILVTLLVIAGLTWLFRRWRENRYRREALRELQALRAQWQEHGDDHQYLLGLQQLLKRVALTRFPREEVASLTGEAWLQFLDRSTGSHEFSMGEAEVLIDGNYRHDIQIDVDALQTVANLWIRKHSERHLQEMTPQEEAA